MVTLCHKSPGQSRAAVVTSSWMHAGRLEALQVFRALLREATAFAR